MEKKLVSQEGDAAFELYPADLVQGTVFSGGRLAGRYKGALSALLAAGSFIVALMIMEAGVRLFLDDRFHVWPPGFHQVFNPPAGVLPGVTGPSHFVVSRDGLRGDPLPADRSYKILAIGGSTTECLYLDDSEAWPYLLQQTLRSLAPIWVGNAGKSGMNTKSHIVQLAHLTQQYPGLDAVIMLIGVNDFLQRLAKGDDYRPFPGVEAMPLPDYEIMMSETFFTWPGSDNREPFFKRLALYRVTREWKYRVLRFPAKQLLQDADGSVYQIWRAHRRQAAAVIPELPDLSSALEEYGRNIRTMAGIAARRGIRLVFASQPFLWRHDLGEQERRLLWLGGVGRYQVEPGHAYYSIEALAEGMTRYNETLLDVCRAGGLECLDLEKDVPKDTGIFYDDVHFTEAGARHVAGVFARYFASGAPFASAK